MTFCLAGGVLAMMELSEKKKALVCDLYREKKQRKFTSVSFTGTDTWQQNERMPGTLSSVWREIKENKRFCNKNVISFLGLSNQNSFINYVRMHTNPALITLASGIRDAYEITGQLLLHKNFLFIYLLLCLAHQKKALSSMYHHHHCMKNKQTNKKHKKELNYKMFLYPSIWITYKIVRLG